MSTEPSAALPPPRQGEQPRNGNVHPRNKLNALSAREWISETVSVWRQRGLGAGHADADIEKEHPAPFSFTDVARLIRFFTKPGHVVLDPFVGVGSTLKAAALEGREGIGVELSPTFVSLAQQRLEREVPSEALARARQQLLTGDCRAVLPTIPEDSVDFIVTSPPYWNILDKSDHKVRQTRTNNGLRQRYSDGDPADLATVSSYDDFLAELAGVFEQCHRVLKPSRYLAVVVGDFRHGSRYFLFHADLAQRLEELGYVLKGVIILYQPNKRVFPYGYPAAYVPNLHHQHILILRKD